MLEQASETLLVSMLFTWTKYETCLYFDHQNLWFIWEFSSSMQIICTKWQEVHQYGGLLLFIIIPENVKNVHYFMKLVSFHITK